VVRWRALVVAFWITVLLATSFLLPNVEQAETGSLGDLVATDADAISTEVRSLELFGFPLLSRTVVVERRPGGFTSGQTAEIYARAAELGLDQLPGLEGIAFALAVTDNVLAQMLDEPAAAALTYLFFPPDIGPVGRTGLAERLVDRQIEAGGGVQAGVTGAVPARGEQIRSIGDALPVVELATVLLIMLAVGLHFRSVVAPLVNIATVAFAYLISLRLIGGFGEAVGVAVPEEVEPVMVALLFGIVTDYVIFFLSRFRSHLQDGTPAQEAARRTAADLTPIVFTAGISVAAAATALIVARLGFFQAFGPGLAVTVLIAIAVVLTLVPAALSLIGDWVFWPRAGLAAEGRGPDGPLGGLRARLRTGRQRLLRLPVRRPALVVALTVLPLLGLSAALLNLQPANTVISGLPVDSPPKQAYRLAAEDFPAGAISPTMILVEEPGIAAKRAELRKLERLIVNRRNFEEVIGPGRLREPAELGAVVSPTGDAVRYLAIFDLNPFGARALRTVGRLRDDLDSMTANAGLPDARASLAGDTAISEETVRKTRGDLARIVPVATLAVFLILAVFLRALVAPVYLVAASLLALGASLGLTVLIFQELEGYGELTFYVPFAGTVLLVALGSDYNIYLVGRVWAEARERPLRQAVAVAGARATSAITVAGIVLALSFAMLALVPLRPFRELAFLLSAGLLIDAFVVRALLAPALITLVGERSGWPGRRLRRRAATGSLKGSQRGRGR
jgi:RND superfamily putative drug exporter